jgi:hypothetical protein
VWRIVVKSGSRMMYEVPNSDVKNESPIVAKNIGSPVM